MIIERTESEVIIRLPVNINIDDLQDFVNYARYKELTSDFKVDQNEVDGLSTEINKGWWAINRNRLVK